MIAKKTFTALLLLAGLATSASADLVSYDVSINTSSLSGTLGGIYLGFFPGFNSDPASVHITAFTPNAGLAGAPVFTHGGVTGALNTNDLVFTNSMFQLNDYGQNVTFGPLLSFKATFDLPNTFMGSSGSELDIQLTGSDLVTPVLTTDPSGNIATIAYDQNGVFTVTGSNFAAITPGSVTPEPAEGWAVAGMAALLLAIRFRTKFTQS